MVYNMTKGRPLTHSREKLLDKGIELFHQHGYHGTSLSAILEACQVSKGSFYNFFSSKEEYAVEILAHYQALEIDRWNQEFAQLQGTHAEKIRRAILLSIEQHDQASENLGCLIAHLSGEIGNASSGFRNAIRRATQRVIELIAEDMRICQLEGSVRQDLPAETLAILIWDNWQGALLRMKVENTTQPLQQSLSLLWDYVLPPASKGTKDIQIS